MGVRMVAAPFYRTIVPGINDSAVTTIWDAYETGRPGHHQWRYCAGSLWTPRERTTHPATCWMWVKTPKGTWTDPCRRVSRFIDAGRISWWFPTGHCRTLRAKRRPASPWERGTVS
jgi:hypothetical protein